jgi:hypothetical protein
VIAEWVSEIEIKINKQMNCFAVEANENISELSKSDLISKKNIRICRGASAVFSQGETLKAMGFPQLEQLALGIAHHIRVS